jgi:hypothetical protein
MTMMKTSTMFEREELVQPIFNFLVGALSMVGCFYFLFIASTLLFRWEGFIVGPADAMTIGEGHVPPALKMSMLLPLQCTSMGMDISVAKRVTLVNLVIVGITASFIFLLERPEELHSCNDDETHILRNKIFVNDMLLTMYALGVAYFSLVPGILITAEYNKALQAGRLADSVLNHIIKNSMASVSAILEIKDQIR